MKNNFHKYTPFACIFFPNYIIIRKAKHTRRKSKMNYHTQEIKEGITLHTIDTHNFKTNLYAVFIATPLKRENVTLDALLTAVLRRGTKNMVSQEEISKKLEEMYGASFDCGIEKTGDNHIIKFYLESISEEFLPEKEELTQKCLDILFDIIFNPFIENDSFKKEYVQGEKQNLKQIIEAKIDNKARYALDRCIEEMFKDESYGLYKYGYVEDLENITEKSLYEYYKKLIANCKIDIFCSGIMDNGKIQNLIKTNEKIEKLSPRKAEYKINNEKTEEIKVEQIKTVEDHMQVNQGKLVIGLSVNSQQENARFTTSVYNAILGGGANSKLFQNVREKEGLAYTAGANYVRQKNTIFVRCGIEIENYEKAMNTIKEQLNDMKNGKFDETDIENAKNLIIESVKSIPSEQDTEITYYYGQELSDRFMTLEEYIEHIEKQSKEEIVDLANKVEINTIYFLRD